MKKTNLLQKRTNALKAILKIMYKEEQYRGGSFDSSDATFNYRMNRIMEIAENALPTK